jgi:hypothetical protein
LPQSWNTLAQAIATRQALKTQINSERAQDNILLASMWWETKSPGGMNLQKWPTDRPRMLKKKSGWYFRPAAL